MTNDKRNQEVWFITGASSGLGLSVLKHVLSMGDIAVATLRKPEALTDLAALYTSSQLLILQLDVTNEEGIRTTFRTAYEKFGRIDVVYNNAGCGMVSEIEGTPLDIARNIFDVNFWGATNVSREAVRYFRDMNKPAGGRLLQASSLAGCTAAPGLGYYAASKFALEGFSEALEKELLPSWNIKIIILEIGVFTTRGVENPPTMPVHPSYQVEEGGGSREMRNLFSGDNLSDFGSAEKAAREMYNIAGDKDAPLHVPLTLETIAAIVQRLDTIKQEVLNSKKWSHDLK